MAERCQNSDGFRHREAVAGLLQNHSSELQRLFKDWLGKLEGVHDDHRSCQSRLIKDLLAGDNCDPDRVFSVPSSSALEVSANDFVHSTLAEIYEPSCPSTPRAPDAQRKESRPSPPDGLPSPLKPQTVVPGAVVDEPQTLQVLPVSQRSTRCDSPERDNLSSHIATVSSTFEGVVPSPTAQLEPATLERAPTTPLSSGSCCTIQTLADDSCISTPLSPRSNLQHATSSVSIRAGEPLRGSKNNKKQSVYSMAKMYCEELTEDPLARQDSGDLLAGAGCSVANLHGQSEFRVKLYRVVHGMHFRTAVSVVIMANAVLIGLAAENDVRMVMKHTGLFNRDVFKYAELGFTYFFLAELLLRIVSDRWHFVVGQDKLWNLFDFLLVSQSLVDVVLTQIQGGQGVPNFSFTRMLRMLRFARILRIIRVMRAFQSFRIMVYSIMHSMISLLWVFMMLFFVVYFFAIFFLHGVSEHYDEVDETSHALLDENYNSVIKTMLVLFMAITSGMDWVDLWSPLHQLDALYGTMFVFYIYFLAFGVLNVVTSIFVDSAYQVSQRDRDLVIQSELARNQVYANDIKSFFYEADKDSSGNLSWEEFEAHLQDERVKAYFASLELDVSQARALFMLLDVDETDEVGIDEFVGGCMRLKGDAKSIDVNMLLYENEKMICKWNLFIQYAENKFEGIDDKLGIVHNEEETQGELQGAASMISKGLVEEGEGYNRLAHAIQAVNVVSLSSDAGKRGSNASADDSKRRPSDARMASGSKQAAVQHRSSSK